MSPAAGFALPAGAGWARAWLLGLAVLLAGLAGIGAAHAQDLRPVPALSARVIDQTATLTDAQRAGLEARLASFEAQATCGVTIRFGMSVASSGLPSLSTVGLLAFAPR